MVDFEYAEDEYDYYMMSDYEQWWHDLDPIERSWLGIYLYHNEDEDGDMIDEYYGSFNRLVEMLVAKYPDAYGRDFDLVEALDEKICRVACCLMCPGVVSFFLIAGKKGNEYAWTISVNP